jgi:uncharacterized protein YozE (UPF0346 family)
LSLIFYDHTFPGINAGYDTQVTFLKMNAALMMLRGNRAGLLGKCVSGAFE